MHSHIFIDHSAVAWQWAWSCINDRQKVVESINVLCIPLCLF